MCTPGVLGRHQGVYICVVAMFSFGATDFTENSNLKIKDLGFHMGWWKWICSCQYKSFKFAAVAWTCTPRYSEAEAPSWEVWGQPEQFTKILCQKLKERKRMYKKRKERKRLMMYFRDGDPWVQSSVQQTNFSSASKLKRLQKMNF